MKTIAGTLAAVFKWFRTFVVGWRDRSRLDLARNSVGGKNAVVDHIVFVHGYSENSLGAYFDFPKRVSDATGVPFTDIYVSAFDSLDDDVTIGDLADALEVRVAAVEATGVSIASSGLIAHSTGALIVRRWMLDRVARNRSRASTMPPGRALDLPSHFISMAGANHGSTLAQSGRSWLGYLQKLWTHHILSVGKRVLTDLDYGSDFLLQLNRQWLIETLAPEDTAAYDVSKAGGLCNLLVFSMGGDVHGDEFGVNIFPPSAEPGSDNTVRISGANLNYIFMVADPEAQTISALPSRPVAHHILRNYSHYGANTGVWGKVQNPDLPVQLVARALGCASPQDYNAIVTDWAADLVTWTGDHPDDANATLVFSLHDRSGAPVEDATVVILDKVQADATQRAALTDSSSDIALRSELTIANLKSVSKCILNDPIRNQANPGAVESFYLNFGEYKNTAPHYYHIEAHCSTPLVEYQVIDYTGPTGPTDDSHVVRANQFTYVDVTMDRLSQKTYRMYLYTDPLPSGTWNPPMDPFPAGYLGVPDPADS